jgi:hypothetical protein
LVAGRGRWCCGDPNNKLAVVFFRKGERETRSLREQSKRFREPRKKRSSRGASGLCVCGRREELRGRRGIGGRRRKREQEKGEEVDDGMIPPIRFRERLPPPPSGQKRHHKAHLPVIRPTAAVERADGVRAVCGLLPRVTRGCLRRLGAPAPGRGDTG